MEDEKKERKAPPFFSAKLRLRDIGKERLTYRIYTSEVVDGKAMEKKGSGILNQEHITFDRALFPVDDDFNMDFMGQDLSDLKPSDDFPAENVKALQKKQKEFRKFLEFDLIIR